MSMTAIFVQVEDAEIDRFESDPDSVEGLFADQARSAADLPDMTATMQARVRAIGPGALAAAPQAPVLAPGCIPRRAEAPVERAGALGGSVST